jgi:hypothetical protein
MNHIHWRNKGWIDAAAWQLGGLLLAVAAG